MIERHLQRQLDKVAARCQYLRFWQVLSLVWLVAAIAGGGLCIWQSRHSMRTDLVAPLLGLGALAVAGAAIGRVALAPRRYDRIARQIETRFPELRSCLLTAIEQRPETPGGRLGYLQASVVRQALDHARRHDWCDIVSRRSLWLAAVANGAMLAVLGLVLVVLASGVAGQGAVSGGIIAPAAPTASDAPFALTVEPGDVEIERGTSLLVLARIQGRLPPQATLHYRGSSDETAELPMTMSLQDPVFGARLPIVEQPLEYQVVVEGTTSPTYRVTVFEFPRLSRADARLVYPEYTKLPERLVQDVRTVSVVEGTRVTLLCYLNKSVATAELVPSSDDAENCPSVALTASPDDPQRYEATIVGEKSRKWKLELTDDAGRKNVKSEQFRIHVVPNQVATIKPVFPARDTEVSALEELDLKATVSDDFGVQRFGLVYALAEREPVEVVLLENGAAKQRQESQHVVRLEELAAEPDQLLSYHWWAEDMDASGNLRRTQSDMYFAEVRPFEEIYRQGQQPTRGEQQQRQQQQQQGQGQNAQDAQNLAKLQKEIVNATWKLIRREIDARPSEAFAADSEQVKLSQASALQQATALAERLQDEQSQSHIETVLRHMRTATEQLAKSQTEPHREPLASALQAEQAAYQALLKLRAREHEVVRQQQQQQQGQSNSQQDSARSQQQREQLQQLDLRDEENRYETQRSAQERQEETQEERENRQVLNRLRELARRQHDLNERLKELQSALEAAAEKEQREEIRRQLQRLQDEQRQILRDTDELQSRLDEPENQERMAEERQQLEETRDQVRRASESLEQERVTQAAAAGTRAEQQFDELREEFRRRASRRFEEEMRQMREASRELDEKQRELAEQIQAPAKSADAQPSLRDEDNREQIAEQLADQRKRLGALQDQMRDTIERAETTEPLLSERLYDSARNLRDQSIEKALQATERAVRQGQTQEAEQRESSAREGLKDLRAGIERAAEGVLGDETEALRRARDELQSLSRELNQELRRNTSEGEEGPPAETPNKPDRVGESDKPGKPEKPPTEGGGESGKPQDRPQTGQASERPGRTGQPSAEKPQTPENQESRSVRGTTGPTEEDVTSPSAPLTGDSFRQWSDRLRDVEEMVDDPALRADAARVRERARSMRADLKRHSAPPNWDLVRDQLSRPLAELENRVTEELARRTSKKALVPLDRDPVLPQYSEKMRRYYQRLGSGE